MPFLSVDDFDHYLALAFAGHQFPEELAAVLHTRTEGNPLFMVDLLRYLSDRGVIVQGPQAAGRWSGPCRTFSRGNCPSRSVG